MRSSKKIILAAAVLLVAAIGAFLVLREPPREQPPEEAAAISDRFDVEAKGIHHEARKNGDLAWTLDADDAGYTREDGQARIRNLRTVLLSADGRKITITASTGIINTKTNDMVLTGDVRVSDGAMRLMTEVLYYTDATRLIRTDTPVRIEADDMDITGDRLRYSLDTNIAHLSGNVKGAFGPMSGK